MDFTIYSIGSSTFLTEVLNGVAMITGSGDIGRMASIGFLLFCMWTCVKYIINPQQGVPWGQAFAGYLMYAVMFGPTVTAYVEDIYTGRVTVTHNVPLGPVAAGSFMSQFGYGLTQLQEQGYGLASDTARLTEGGYIDPLKTLVGLRRKEVVDLALQGVDQSIGGNAKHTLFNYIRDCTMRKPSLEGQDSYDDIMTGQLPDALFLNNNFYTTEIFTGSGPQTEDCVSAQTRISFIFTRLEESADIHEQITTVLRSDKMDETLGRPNSIQRLEDFFNGFPEISASNSIALMQAGIVLPLVQAAEAAHLKDGLDSEAATAYNMALQGRNAQWAAEGNSFLDTVRPFLAYVEGLSFAVAPLAAIIVIMGAAGISLVGKYMMLFFWIQLWMPILSITNLYLIQAASDKFNTLAAGNSNFNMGSFYAFSTMSDIAESWVAVGAAMMAATPFISLFVVSGSIYTMNQLAGRMSSADTFDEGRVSPKMGSAPAALSEAPVMQHDVTSATRHSGAEGAIGSFDASRVASNAVSASTSSAIQAQDGFSQTYSQLASNAQTRQSTFNTANSAMSSTSFQNSQAFQEASSVADRVAQTMGISNEDRSEFTSQVTAGMSASPNLKGFGFGVSGSDTFRTSSGQTISASDVKEAIQGTQWSESDGIALRGEFANAFREEASTSDSTAFTQQQQNQIGTTAQQSYTASQQHQETLGFTESLGMSGSVKMNTAANLVNNSPEARQAIDSAYGQNVAQNPGLAHAAEQTRNSLVSNHGVSAENAETAGRLVALLGQGNWEDGNRDGYMSTFDSFKDSGVFSSMFGFVPGNPGTPPMQGPEVDPSRNEYLVGQGMGAQSTAPNSPYDAGAAANINGSAQGNVTDHAAGGRYSEERGQRIDASQQEIGNKGLDNFGHMMSRLGDAPLSGTTAGSAASDIGSSAAGFGSQLLDYLNVGNFGDARENAGRGIIQSIDNPQEALQNWTSGFQEYASGSTYQALNAADMKFTQGTVGQWGDGSLGNVIENYGSDEMKAAWNNLSEDEQAQAAVMYTSEVRGQLSAASQYGGDNGGDTRLAAVAASDAPQPLQRLQMAAIAAEYGQSGISPDAMSSYDIPSYQDARNDMQDFLQYISGKDDVSAELETIERHVANDAGAAGSGNIATIAMALESGANSRHLVDGGGDIFRSTSNGGFTPSNGPDR